MSSIASISRRATVWALLALLAPALALAFALTPITAQAQTFTVLHNFNGTKGAPANFDSGSLAQGRDGNFYAESQDGGSANFGCIFQLTPAGTVSVIHSLTGPDGQYPGGGITLGPDGNLYGNSIFGGANNLGAIFQVTPAGTLTVLHSFSKTEGAANPIFALVQGNDGNFYGNAFSKSQLSIIYKITPTGGYSTVYSFTGAGNDVGQLSLGSDGNLYGTTCGIQCNGKQGYGTLFQLTPAGVLTNLYTLGPIQGKDPLGVVQATDGTFYGSALYGGDKRNGGTLFSLSPSGVFTLLYSFTGKSDGGNPVGQLLLASDGNFYGATESDGGTDGCGTLFQITPGGVFSVVHTFDYTHGCSPKIAVIQGTDGVLFGLTQFGGSSGDYGVFYSLDLSLPAYAGLDSPAGKQGGTVGILGQGFSKSSVVTFGGGVQATSITLEGSTFISAVIPAGATTGPVTVTTGSTTLTSIQDFHVLP